MKIYLYSDWITDQKSTCKSCSDFMKIWAVKNKSLENVFWG